MEFVVGTPSRSSVRGMLYGIEDGWEHTGLILGANARTLDLWTINGNWGKPRRDAVVDARRRAPLEVRLARAHAVLRELVAEHRP